jgi:hypothetical protein
MLLSTSLFVVADVVVVFNADVVIDIKALQNILLKVCYVPATSASLPRLLFIYFFAAAIDSTNEANKSGSTCCLAVYIT